MSIFINRPGKVPGWRASHQHRGSHLVDTSPLSTLGALCITCAGEHEDKTKLFRKLLIWGLSMSVVGAIAWVLFFGILGW